MTQYIIRRLLLSIPVIFGILLVTFALARIIPGDPCKAILGEKATPEVCERFYEEHGLNDPIPVQFANYIADFLRGDLGDSLRYGRPVIVIIIERLPTTIELSLAALFLAVSIGIPLGLISALRQNSWIDLMTMFLANIGVSMPVYWLGLLLAYTFALLLKGTPLWLPPAGRLSPALTATPFYEVWGWQVEPETFRFYALHFISNMYILNSLLTRDWTVLKDALRHLILPAAALSTIPMAIIARMTRSSMLEVLRQDYVKAARAKGLRTPVVILKHAFRNALIPVVTIIGLQVGLLFSGAVLTETIFSFAGVGSMLYEAITARDYPVVQGFTVIIAMVYVFVNLAVDILYVFIDPRIRLE